MNKTEEQIVVIVKNYQLALKEKNSEKQKQYFTAVFKYSEKMMWYIAWRAWRRCKNKSAKYECIAKNKKWHWKNFNVPLISGLHLAAKRFDSRKNVKFSSFAYSFINQSIINYCARECDNDKIYTQLPEDLAVGYTEPDLLTVQYDEVHAAIDAIKQAYPENAVEYKILILYILGFTQKDIVFLLNELGCSCSTSSVNHYIRINIPEKIVCNLNDKSITKLNIDKFRENQTFCNSYFSLCHKETDNLLSDISILVKKIWNFKEIKEKFDNLISVKRLNKREKQSIPGILKYILSDRKSIKNFMKDFKSQYLLTIKGMKK